MTKQMNECKGVEGSGAVEGWGTEVWEPGRGSTYRSPLRALLSQRALWGRDRERWSPGRLTMVAPTSQTLHTHCYAWGPRGAQRATGTRETLEKGHIRVITDRVPLHVPEKPPVPSRHSLQPSGSQIGPHFPQTQPLSFQTQASLTPTACKQAHLCLPNQPLL